MWGAEDVAAYRHEEKAIEHAQTGVLHLDCDVLTVGNDELRLIVYAARRRSETADRLHESLNRNPSCEVSA